MDGEPAAMTVTLPNLNEAIADLRRPAVAVRLGEAAVAAQAAGPRTARMPLMGVRKKYQGTPRGRPWRSA